MTISLQRREQWSPLARSLGQVLIVCPSAKLPRPRTGKLQAKRVKFKTIIPQAWNKKQRAAKIWSIALIKVQQAATAGVQYRLTSLYPAGEFQLRAVLWDHMTIHYCACPLVSITGQVIVCMCGLSLLLVFGFSIQCIKGNGKATSKFL